MIVNNVRSIHGFPKSADKRGDSETRYVRAVILVLLLACFAQAQQTWIRTYGGTDEDEGWSVQQTLDSGYIIAGQTASFGAGYSDFYLIKTNAAGDTLWTMTYGGTINDWGRSVQQTLDTGYIIAGYTTSYGAGSFDFYLIKTNALGVPVWTKTIGGAGGDVARSVRQVFYHDTVGYIIAGVTTSFGAGSYDFYLVKTDAFGDTQWTRTYGGTNEDVGYSVQQTSDSGYIFTGYTVSFGHGSDEDVWLIKTNEFGDTQWTRTYGGAGNDVGCSVQQTSDGGYVIAGYTSSFGHPGNDDIYLIKTDTAGDTLWTRTYGWINADEGYSVRQTSDGGYIIAGQTMSFGAGAYDAYLIKTNALGDTLWYRTYGGNGVDLVYSVQQTLDGGYIATGSTAPMAGTGDVYLIKMDANGRAGVEEPVGSRQKAVGSVKATPNPFASFARVPRHETERFELYDASGKKQGTYLGNRIGEGLPPGVYFVRLVGEHGRSLRVVKVSSGQ
jgi:hypothetical protein